MAHRASLPPPDDPRARVAAPDVAEALARAATGLVDAGVTDPDLAEVGWLVDALALSDHPVQPEVTAGLAAALGGKAAEALVEGATSAAEIAARFGRLRALVVFCTVEGDDGDHDGNDDEIDGYSR